MKLSLAVLLFASLLVPTTRSVSASAAPAATAREDALADGDIDVEDVATKSPLAELSRARSAKPVLGGPTTSTTVSVVGFSRRTIDDLQEVGGFVVVELPLDRLARGPARATTGPALERPEMVPVAATSRSELVLATEQPFDLALTPRLARSCVAAAWRAAGLGADDARLDSILSRARWSAALPEARLRAVRFEDARLSLDTGTDTSRLRDSAGANVGFEARLTWRLDRLLYADDEPAIERIRIEQRDARTRIAARVLEALFHWQRAALDLRSLPPSQHGTRDEADVRLRLMEAEAALDILTNGAFAAQRSRRERDGSRGYAAPVPTDLAAPSQL